MKFELEPVNPSLFDLMRACIDATEEMSVRLKKGLPPKEHQVLDAMCIRAMIDSFSTRE